MLECGAQPAHLSNCLLGGTLGVERDEAFEDGFVTLSPGPSPASGRGEQVLPAVGFSTAASSSSCRLFSTDTSPIS
ncbi:MAG: hypothetical protein M5R42_14810 [Rhodocyclaceae bacterium]|nr:hypothetical protein [Rhodocyclaceae bacterium]